MAIRSIRRGSANPGGYPGTANAAPIYVNSSTNTLKYIPAGSGTTEVEIIDASSTQSLTNKTFGQGNVNSDVKVLAATATFTSASVLTSLTGFSWTVVPGTYRFYINVPATMTTNGGLSLAFKLTTAVLTSIQAQTYASTASDNTLAVSTQSTTTTDQTKYFDSKTSAYTYVRMEGTFVVGTGGSIALQAAQNTSNSDTTSVLLGTYGEFTRVS